MCAVCAMFEKGKLTTQEAKRALWELVNTVPQEEVRHLQETYSKVEEREAQIMAEVLKIYRGP